MPRGRGAEHDPRGRARSAGRSCRSPRRRRSGRRLIARGSEMSTSLSRVRAEPARGRHDPGLRGDPIGPAVEGGDDQRARAVDEQLAGVAGHVDRVEHRGRVAARESTVHSRPRATIEHGRAGRLDDVGLVDAGLLHVGGLALGPAAGRGRRRARRDPAARRRPRRRPPDACCGACGIGNGLERRHRRLADDPRAVALRVGQQARAGAERVQPRARPCCAWRPPPRSRGSAAMTVAASRRARLRRSMWRATLTALIRARQTTVSGRGRDG